MRKLLRLFILILLAPLIYSFAYEAYLFLVSNARPLTVNWFALGFLLYLFLYVPILHGTMDFIEHFAHESAHALVAFMCLKGIHRFTVNPRPQPGEEGSSVVGSPGPNCLISLAPYYLPIFVLPLLIIKLIVIPKMHGLVNGLIGVATGFHCALLFRTFRPRQKDIQETGLLASVGITAILNVIFLVVIAHGVLNRYADLPDYLRHSLARTLESYRTVFQSLISNL